MPRAREIVKTLAAECVPREVEEKLVEELFRDLDEAYEYLLKYISMRGITCYSQIVYAINRLNIRDDAISLLLSQAICPTRVLPPRDVGRRLHYLHAPPSLVKRAVLTLLNMCSLEDIIAAVELVAGYAAPWNSGYIYRHIYPELIRKARDILLGRQPVKQGYMRLLHALVSLVGVMEKGYDQLAELVHDAIVSHMSSRSDEARLHCSRCLRRLARLLKSAPVEERKAILDAIVAAADVLIKAYREEPLYEVKANILDAVCFILKCVDTSPEEAEPLIRVLKQGLQDVYPENRERARECLEKLGVCLEREDPLTAEEKEALRAL